MSETMIIRIRKQYILDSSFYRHVVRQEVMKETALLEYELSAPFIYIDGVVVRSSWLPRWQRLGQGE